MVERLVLLVLNFSFPLHCGSWHFHYKRKLSVLFLESQRFIDSSFLTILLLIKESYHVAIVQVVSGMLNSEKAYFENQIYWHDNINIKVFVLYSRLLTNKYDLKWNTCRCFVLFLQLLKYNCIEMLLCILHSNHIQSQYLSWLWYHYSEILLS